ncbi:hypothetical protein BFW88_11980 [Pseudomonas fluorescens]|uniref:hypothetical protein n=1 Tax=Pseudomonas TaxID=286 RepID=UPI0001E977B4|nr:hypothetical protein [Pseudomonas sp. FP597]EFQ63932.1 hypothetical protein PFWH6_2383 [Pseudomonas fluorescens WH6]OPA92288.1 hypothetical protein BFW88_11980 [Pseudomonas fluorescens]OPB10938.1 hypothetical protein BFW92_11945 [Pseudomonas fluorescens]OPB22585.1 hypothetical protein BFW93_11965 [Pseudomonas fluorescens]WLI09284.1 hypothetical protein PSH66_13440 [Pseudomonas sp. FP597]
MNSEQLSPADVVHFTITRQAIVERSQALWGSEIAVSGTGDRVQLDSAYSQALQHTLPRRKTPQVVSHRLVKIDQAALMNEALIKDIFHVAQTLEKQGHAFTLSIDNPLDTLPGPVERRAMVRQLYRLKDQNCINLAYDNYTLDTKPGDLLTDLKLYDYIKMPLPDSALRLSLNTRSGLFDRLYDHMLELIHATRVRFIAKNVEFFDSAMLAKNLPFEYFQGGYYSPADRL